MGGEPIGGSVVDLTRASFACGNRCDYAGMTRRFATDCALDLSAMGLGTFEGEPAIRRFFEDWIGAFEYWRIDVEEVSDLGNGVVFVLARQLGDSGGLRRSRGLFRARHAVVCEWLNGVAVRVTNHLDLAEAQRCARTLAERPFRSMPIGAAATAGARMAG